MTGSSARSIRGTMAAASAPPIEIDTQGFPVVAVEVAGTFVQTLIVEETISGDNWVTAQSFDAAGGAVSATITAPGRCFVNAGGRSGIRVRQTAFTSGTATVVMDTGEGIAAAASGGGGGGGAVTVADGADVAEGATTDAAVTTNAAGTLSGKIRGLVAILADVWDSVNHWLTVRVAKIPGTVSAANSSTATLTANAIFTGTSEDVSGYAAIIINVFADQAGTLAPEFSSDGTHWDGIGSHAVTASTFAVFEFRPGAQFFRLVYTNGGTNQGAFRLQTVYHQNDVQLATVAALGAGMPNPTTEQIGANLLVQTAGGTSWAPAKADGSNRLIFASDDGSQATLGTTTDAGIITNIAGTVIGFLRGGIIQWAAFLARFPAALISGRLDVNLGAAPAAVTLGAGAAAIGSVTVTGTPAISGTVTANQGTQGAGGTASWPVQGAGAAGAALAGNPVLMGGSDGTNAVTIRTPLVSSANSSTATLAGNAVFTGTGEDVSQYGSVTVLVTADVASAAQGVSIQFSPDNANWDFKQTFSYGAQPNGNIYTSPVYAKFFRLVYTNGAGGQAAFRLQAIYHVAALPVQLTTGTLLSGNNYVQPATLFAGLDGSSNVRALSISAGTDGVSSTLQQLEVKAHQYLYNGTSDDRARANIITNQFNGTNTTSGITNHATQTNYSNTGLIATLNITAASGTTPTLDIKIQIADGAGTFFDLTDSAGNVVAFKQQTTTGTDTLKLSPSLVERLTAVANKQYNGQLGRTYRFVSTLGGTTPSFTYRLDVSELK